MKKRTLSLLGVTLSLLGITLMAGSLLGLLSCLNSTGFDPDFTFSGNITGQIETTDVTAAVLMLTNRSKTVDVTHVTITQPEWRPPQGNSTAQSPSVSFSNKPRRLEKKAQYLAPSDKSYQVVIDFSYDELTIPSGAGTQTLPSGTGTQTVLIPLPLPKQIVEYIIYRNDKGVVIIDKEATDPDPGDTGNPAVDPLPGEGSSPAVIAPENRTKMGTFIVINKTNSQMIDSAEFKMGNKEYAIGKIGVHDKQSIALGQGTWESSVSYTRNGNVTLGPLNSIIVPSNDPQAIREHYLYFYLNKRGDYAISQEWPPFPNDVEEEDLMPFDNGYGRGLVKIINNSYAIAEMVTIHNLRDLSRYQMSIDYGRFTPPIPVQYNKTGYVDIVGTAAFPIEAHEGYLIQVTLENSGGVPLVVERKAYIKDQVVTIVIEANDLKVENTRGAKVTLENKTVQWPVEIIYLTVRNKVNEWQSTYYNADTWEPAGTVKKGQSAVQYVMSSTAMPIVQNEGFKALVAIRGGDRTTVLVKEFTSPVLYSDLSPGQNTRTITITDADVPDDMKSGLSYAKIILKNQISTWPVDIIGMRVENTNQPTQHTIYDITTWTPDGLITRSNNAAQTVMTSTAMPITPTAQFKAEITLHSGGITETLPWRTFSPAELYTQGDPNQNIRTIIITDADVPPSLRNTDDYTRGATFTIVNATRANPVQVMGMMVQSTANPLHKTLYSVNDWNPGKMIGSGQNATVTVMSSSVMPITPGVPFRADLYLYANDIMKAVPVNFNPAELYSTKDPAQNTRTLTVNDSDVPPELQPPIPPTPGNIGSLVTLENGIVSWPVQIIGMTVRNKARIAEKTSYGASSWSPIGLIDKSGHADQEVWDSAVMPIAQGDQFEALITLYYNGTSESIPKKILPAELYSTNPPAQNTRTITVTDSDVPQKIIDAYNLSRGAKVILKNEVSTKWPVQITAMTVQNIIDHSQASSYSSYTWEPKAVIGNNQTGEQMVYSSTAMLITPNTLFEAVITLRGNGKEYSKTINISPSTLYSTLDPEKNIRTIKITDSDVPPILQTPDVPNPPTPEKPDIGGAKDGDIVVIDGIEWVKVRTDTRYPDLVLLMLNGVTGPLVKYDNNGRTIEYGATAAPSIKGYVDTWYAALNSPTLKQIAYKVGLGTTPNPTWAIDGPGPAGATNYVGVAFIPRLKDITKLNKANSRRYWLSDIYPDDQSQPGLRYSMVGIIMENGDNNIHVAAANSTIYVRPCIWVTSK